MQIEPRQQVTTDDISEAVVAKTSMSDRHFDIELYDLYHVHTIDAKSQSTDSVISLVARGYRTG